MWGFSKYNCEGEFGKLPNAGLTSLAVQYVHALHTECSVHRLMSKQLALYSTDYLQTCLQNLVTHGESARVPSKRHAYRTTEHFKSSNDYNLSC